MKKDEKLNKLIDKLIGRQAGEAGEAGELVKPVEPVEPTQAFMYILLCGNDSYYVGSTKHLKLRIQQHCEGIGAKHTKLYPPIQLVYLEKFNKIQDAFNREKQIQRWSRAKKEALINGDLEELKRLSKSKT